MFIIKIITHRMKDINKLLTLEAISCHYLAKLQDSWTKAMGNTRKTTTIRSLWNILYSKIT
jgi:hypothetical protein